MPVSVVTPAPSLVTEPEPLPAGLSWQPLDAQAYADVVGALRGSPPAQCQAHGQRLALSPVPYQGWALQGQGGQVLACGQSAAEADLVGLYDVFTHPAVRGQGLARRLCAALLHQAQAAGAQVAYLQVDADNAPARTIYQRLGFVDAYRYHYRTPDRDAT